VIVVELPEVETVPAKLVTAAGPLAFKGEAVTAAGVVLPIAVPLIITSSLSLTAFLLGATALTPFHEVAS
jgi:hypothetical protein